MQNKSQAGFFIMAAPLLLVLFIDGMGLGLVMPILNGLIFNPDSGFMPDMSPRLHNVIYGLIISIFMLCWFFGAAMLGDLSDKIGRKKSLLICLIGAFLSYILSAISVGLHSLTLLVIGRIIAGLTSGSQPIAQAAIIDLSDPQHKARNIGYILLSLSLGFIVGPLCGGILSDNNLVSWFNFATPFYFASTVSFINIIFLLILFKETFVSKHTTFAVNPYQAINVFISAFKNENVRNLSIIFFIFIFGWSSFYSFIGLYLLKIYNLSSTGVSLYMAVMGVGFGIGTGYLVNYLARLFTLGDIFKYTAFIGAIIVGVMIACSQLVNWLLVAPLACAVSIAYAAILTIFSNQVDADSQGWVMGITGSIMAFVWALNAIIVGVAAAWDATIPLIIAAVTLLLTAIVSLFSLKNGNYKVHSDIKVH